MKMAIVHDLAECIVGDITPHCGVSVEEKHAREEVSLFPSLRTWHIQAAMLQLTTELNKELADEIVGLWRVSFSHSLIS